ncbi:hypothetical protein TI05_15815 [Achromatium sp. WMS3]|nr:hypothetical protein TI05_15815 [Achromatium sp. WMS3]
MLTTYQLYRKLLIYGIRKLSVFKEKVIGGEIRNITIQNKFRNLLSTVIVLSVTIVFGILSYWFIQERHTIQDIGLLLLVILAPIPLTIFVAYILAIPIENQGDVVTRPYIGKAWKAVLFVIIGSLLIMALAHTIKAELTTSPTKIMFPLLVNSSVISLYVVDYYQFRSASLAGFLTGVSFGMVLYFIFFINDKSI